MTFLHIYPENHHVFHAPTGCIGTDWFMPADPDNMSPAITCILLTITALAVAVPNAPGYIGAIQAAYVFALSPFGISEEAAFSASILFLVIQWIPVTAAGGRTHKGRRLMPVIRPILFYLLSICYWIFKGRLRTEIPAPQCSH